MKFIMTQTELERAVQQYVRKLIPGLDANTVIEPEFKATRGADGFTAEVDILSPEDLAEAAPKAATTEAPPAPKPAAPKAAPASTPAPTPAPITEMAEESLNQDEEPAPAEEPQQEPTQEPVAQEEPAPEAAVTTPAKRPLFGIRQPS